MHVVDALTVVLDAAHPVTVVAVAVAVDGAVSDDFLAVFAVVAAVVVAVNPRAVVTGAAAVAATTGATMDQVDSRFAPHILVVQTGTSVEFPNSDVIAHHVYSFSQWWIHFAGRRKPAI